MVDVVVEFECVLKLEAEDFGGGFVFECGVVDCEFDVGEGVGVEGRVCGFSGVGDEIVTVQVCDELVEVVLGVFL